MKFRSTGGRIRGVSFEEAIFTGFAADGGVLMPEEIDRFSPDDLAEMRKMSYVEVVKKVAAKFITESDIPPSDLNDLIEEAFRGFPEPENILPLRQLTPRLHVLEMWHGPTLAFKDFGLSCLAQFVKFFQRQRQRQAVAIIATTGDTGSAALEAFKDVPLIEVIVLLPKGWCTEVQELQMTTVGGSNTHVVRVDGDGDELDVVAKAVLLDEELGENVRLFSVNSINFGRILAQAAHHIFAYLQASANFDGEVQVVIPSGSLGNISSGCLARAMGVPVKFVLCTNSNDIAHRMLLLGSLRVGSEMQKSHASAMNVQFPYNLQRLFWLFAADKEEAVRLKRDIEAHDCLTLPEELLDGMRKVIVDSCSVSNDQILATMSEAQRRFDYLVCPHTACALAYCLDHEADDVTRVAEATASPAKFQEVVTLTSLECPSAGDLLSRLKSKAARYEDWQRDRDWTDALRAKICTLLAAGP